MIDKPVRVMWLLNHGSARKFELSVMKSVGINEFFLPKRVPQEISFRSASVDYSEDQYLTIPKEDLDVLNKQDWYGTPSKTAWEIANKHFDICFFICHTTGFLQDISQHYKGAAIWRTYGVDQSTSYTKILNYLDFGPGSIRRLGPRFWFGMAYDHLAEQETAIIRSRQLYLPLGMPKIDQQNTWSGKDEKIFFVCPDIGFNSYYRKVYEEFKRDFGEFPYKIGGSQPIAVNDPAVQGFAPQEIHERNMAESRVMFYHSQEPNHIHFHPFEAVRAGLPLLFMAGGMLDRMGGLNLPGRCVTIAQAKAKVKKLLNGDASFTDAVIASQVVLLESMNVEVLRPYWERGMRAVVDSLAATRLAPEGVVEGTKRIAVILPEKYKGGTLRGAKLLAEALLLGSQAAGEPAEIIFCHREDDIYSDNDFEDLLPGIRRRPFNWKTLPADSARRAMKYSGDAEWEPDHNYYCAPDDGINHLCDCHLWVFVSDRISLPLLPIRPTVFMVYDYLQRYEAIMPPNGDEVFLLEARTAKRVLVTTEFTHNDAINYAGIEASRISRVPMLAPLLVPAQRPLEMAKTPYFLWTTNAAPHKNQKNSLTALKIYYEELGGRLTCMITGVNSKKIKKGVGKAHKISAEMIKQSKALRRNLLWVGELPEQDYKFALSAASYLWHTARVDNGTFSVIEAACLGVPSLSSDYPAMREIDKQFSLALKWMNPLDPREMAQALLEMEKEYEVHKLQLPTREQLETQSVEDLSGAYWRVIAECL